MNQSMNPTASAGASSGVPADRERASEKRVAARSLSRRGTTRAANSARYRGSSSSAADRTPASRGGGAGRSVTRSGRQHFLYFLPLPHGHGALRLGATGARSASSRSGPTGVIRWPSTEQGRRIGRDDPNGSAVLESTRYCG